MKPLNPAIREKKRYLLLEGNNLKESSEKAILDYVGVLGYSQASPNWIKCSAKKGILGVNRESLNHVKAAFLLGKDKINVKKVSGTIKGLGRK